jgi:hypothetical protein
MRTPLRIQTRIGNNQSLHEPAADDVRVHNFIDIGCSDAAVPHRIRVDHDRRAVLALVQAPGFVGANRAFNAALRQFDFEGPLKFALTFGIATAARIACGPLVGANEDMTLKFQSTDLTKSAGRRLQGDGPRELQAEVRRQAP